MFAKYLSILVFTIFVTVHFLTAQNVEHSKRIIEEIKAHKSGVAIWWTGHNGWLIKSDNILIGTDLALEQEDRAVASPISAAELAPELNISFITHEHGDHFERETSRILVEKGNCIFVMPANCEQIAKEEANIPSERIRIAKPREPFSIGEVKIEPIRAIHGGPRYAVFYEANFEDCGYLITIGGKRLLQMGDTVLLEDHLFIKHVDVLFFSPTEHNTHIEHSVLLINELEPDYILPQHRNTFEVTDQNRYWTTGYPDEVKFRLSKQLQENYFVVEPGKKLVINP